MDLIVTGGHDGLLAAVSSLFPATLRKRCVVHKQRNVMNAIPYREQKEVAAELAGIWKQERKEDALLNLAAFKAKYRQRYPEAVRSLIDDEEHLLTFYAFPPVMHRYIRSTNAIESFFSNVRQRTDQIDAFTTETSCLTIVWAVMQDIRLPKKKLTASHENCLHHGPNFYAQVLQQSALSHSFPRHPSSTYHQKRRESISPVRHISAHLDKSWR